MSDMVDSCGRLCYLLEVLKPRDDGVLVQLCVRLPPEDIVMLATFVEGRYSLKVHWLTVAGVPRRVITGLHECQLVVRMLIEHRLERDNEKKVAHGTE